jgi:SAM-dependent methyltransferase
MTDATTLHQDQIEYWNGRGGENWVSQQAQTDLMLAPVSDILLAHAGIAPGTTVLDLGCGCGTTTESIARLVGPAGKVIGFDVSKPMLDVAARRLGARTNVTLICADAATYGFTPLSVDILTSRFGVMFFGDPRAAFANFGRALKPGGRLVFTCWQKIDENPWMQIPLLAAYAHVPRLPKPAPEDPGPFAFADTERVTRILTGAGFTNLRFTPRTLPIDIAGGHGLEDAVEQAAHIGATSRALDGQPETAQRAALSAVREALRPYATPTGVLLKGTIWIVEATWNG